MPHVERAVSLSDAERDLLLAAVAPQAAANVIKEATASLRSGGPEVKNLLRTRTVGADAVRATKAAVEQRRKSLDSLPEGEIRDAHRHEVVQALQVLDEAERLLND